MTTPRDFFTVELEWVQTGRGFVPRNDDRDPQTRPFWTAAQERLFRRGVVHEGSVIARHLPVWSLLHINPNPYGSMWCFVEQGHDGAFGPTGGCRASFVKFATHPADVWRAGRDLAWTPLQRVQLDVAVARETLSAVAADRHTIPLPPDVAGNAPVIEALLDLLPARVARAWVWSTLLLGTADRFVAGRMPAADPAGQDRDPATTPFGPAFDRLAGELGRVSPEVIAAVRASKDERLDDFLRVLAFTTTDQRALDSRPATVTGRHAVVPPSPDLPERDTADIGTVETLTADTGSAPPGRPAGAVPARPTAVVSSRAPAPAPSLFTWVEWADTGTGFERLPGGNQQDRRRFWHAAELLLDSEKVPVGVDSTLQHPLWTLRWVPVDGIGTWCFVERGRGKRSGSDGKAERERQFGMAGGCRFGFADFRHPPRTVWRAGMAEAWTQLPPEPKPAKPDRKLISSVLAGLVLNQERIALPDEPIANRLLIEQILAVLPRDVAARWVWSTCLFRWTEQFVGGPPPQDLRSVDAVTRLAARITAERMPSEERIPRSHSEHRAPAFQRLVREANTAATKAVSEALQSTLERSEATDLPGFLDEMLLHMKLRRVQPKEVPSELLTEAGQTNLHRDAPEAVVEWARTEPGQARQHLIERPESAAATEVIEGLLEVHRLHPTANVLGVPTAKTPRSPWADDRSTSLLRAQLPDVQERADLIRPLIAPGAALYAPADLAAAEPFLRNMDLAWEDYPQFYPNRIIRELAVKGDLSPHAVTGLCDSPDPVTLVLDSILKIQRPTIHQASRLILAMYKALVVQANPDREPLDRVAAALLTRVDRGERQRWWAEVNKLYGLPAIISDEVRSMILTSGVRMLYEIGKEHPLTDPELYALTEQVGLEIDYPFEITTPEERFSWLREWLRKVRGLRLSRRAIALFTVLLLLVGGGAVATFLVSLDDTPVAPTPSVSQPAHPQTGSASGSPTGSPGPDPTESASQNPSPSVATPQATKLVPFLVDWESDGQTAKAVEKIRTTVEGMPGRRPVHIRLYGYATLEYQANNAVKAIEEALKKANIPQLTGVDFGLGGEQTNDRKLRGKVEVTISTVPA